MRYALSLALLVFPLWAFAAEKIVKADQLVVIKSEKRLYLYRMKHMIASYPVSLGGNPQGHKQQAGDGRTPEGQYQLDSKKTDSNFHKAIHISYPNTQDRENARKRGVNPGGAVMIHGQKRGFAWAALLTQQWNWTRGCIALSNSDMDALWSRVDIGTPIEIKP